MKIVYETFHIQLTFTAQHTHENPNMKICVRVQENFLCNLHLNSLLQFRIFCTCCLLSQEHQYKFSIEQQTAKVKSKRFISSHFNLSLSSLFLLRLVTRITITWDTCCLEITYNTTLPWPYIKFIFKSEFILIQIELHKKSFANI